MKFLEGKMKFLAIKLSALQSELDISKKIFIQASAEVDRMFKEKYFPEVPPEPKKPKNPQSPQQTRKKKKILSQAKNKNNKTIQSKNNRNKRKRP